MQGRLLSITLFLSSYIQLTISTPVKGRHIGGFKIAHAVKHSHRRYPRDVHHGHHHHHHRHQEEEWRRRHLAGLSGLSGLTGSPEPSGLSPVAPGDVAGSSGSQEPQISVQCEGPSPLDSYTVPGLGQRKAELLSAGATHMDLAVAMLESDHMQPTPNADNKIEDSANFGVFNQNWFMLRHFSSQFTGQTTADWKNGFVLNNDLKADIKSLHDVIAAVGVEKWFAGQRNGQTGFEEQSVSDDIATYTTAIKYIQCWLEDGHLNDDQRVIYNVQHI